jgi:predicted DNA-binding helix-hairpin-helix protein
MELERKLALLADAAKYDASCASSGAPKRQATPGRGIGSTTGMGICHCFTPDGRCVSLLKILLTNFCIYDCLYCVNRRSSDVPRACFAVSEVVSLTLSFYRRNYIAPAGQSTQMIVGADSSTDANILDMADTLYRSYRLRRIYYSAFGQRCPCESQIDAAGDAAALLASSAGGYGDTRAGT